MARPTINDISRLTGVSPTAVSFALNDRPGVSDATRARVEEVARQLGWRPSVAATALSSGRAQAVGLAIKRPSRSFTGERFYMNLIAGIEQVLTPRSMSLVLQFVDDSDDELAAYERWHSARRVDGVILTDPRENDPRPALLSKLSMPGIYVGAEGDLDMPGAGADDAAAIRQIVTHLADLGHRVIGYVPGRTDLLHTQHRVQAFRNCCAEREVAWYEWTSTDYTEDEGQAATRALRELADPPTALIYDNEVLAMGGYVALRDMNLAIPDEVAVVSFEDSPVCRIVRPAITALNREPAELGAIVTEMLLQALDDETPKPRARPEIRLEVRGSTVGGD